MRDNVVRFIQLFGTLYRVRIIRRLLLCVQLVKTKEIIKACPANFYKTKLRNFVYLNIDETFFCEIFEEKLNCID